MIDALKKEDRVLIVDDTVANLQLLGSFLQKNGYQINVAQNGLRALEAVKAMPPDLILLDIMMPEMDGYETCRQLKADLETKDIPVIFLTAKTEPQDIIKGFKLGAVDYLVKPFNAEELLARVKTHLELRRAREVIEQQKTVLEKQNLELIESAKLREDVELMVRHDLKTPLNVVIGYPQILLRKEDLTEKGKGFVKTIEQAGYRMLKMINLSLDLFKMERGTYQVYPVPIDILQVLRKILADMSEINTAEILPIQVVVSGRPLKQEDTFIVSGEELLCYSMLSNLLKNALEASPAGEDILIKVDKKETVTISIHNKGTVPQEIHDQFFEKYTTFGKTTGTGLGTYSAKLIAETQQGTIGMVSSAVEGTIITIQMPDK
jgi:two-component system sensor histidine kinase/response regulator